MTLTSEPKVERATGARKPIDAVALRRDFPILDQEINGHRLVYLDSASSSQKPNVVIDAVADYYREYNANVHRGIYTIGEKATAEYEKARARVARFINAPDSHEVVFTRNATEAINLVSYSWGRRNIDRGDAIVLTEMEHHANLVPWQILVQEKDGDLEFIPITDDGILRLDVFEVLLRLKPKLVAFTHVSNTLGTINPVREMTEMAHAAGALVLIDGAQAVPHVPVDVQELGADFYAFSGHKMLAPMGSGALWARRELLEAMPPFLAGGEMIREVHLRRSEFNEIPWKFEAGTPAVGDAIGLGVAAEYLMDLGMDAVREHERDLVAYALEVLPREVPGIELYGPMDPDLRGGVVPVQPARASTRMTSPRSWTGSGSPCVPATTARCRSTSGWTWPPRREPHSTSTRRARTSMPWPPASSKSSASSTSDGRPSYTDRPMDDLYRDYILEHYRRPHNFGVIEDADASYEGANPLCGDRITLMLGVKDGIVDRVGFTGRGCAISQASASLLTDEIKGKPLSDVSAFRADDLLELLGIEISPARLKCAMLSHDSLQHVLTDLGAADPTNTTPSPAEAGA